jgi:hypothetical protein
MHNRKLATWHTYFYSINLQVNDILAVLNSDPFKISPEDKTDRQSLTLETDSDDKVTAVDATLYVRD